MTINDRCIVRVPATIVLLALLLTAQEPAAAPADQLEAAFARALPPEAESLSTLIPWRRSLTQALAEAKASGKPVYLFVNDGAVDCGRC